MNPRKKKDGSRDGFLVFIPGKKLVLHDESGTPIATKTLLPKEEVKEGDTAKVGNWECEVGGAVPIESFDSGAALAGSSMVVAPTPAPTVSAAQPARRPLRPVQPLPPQPPQPPQPTQQQLPGQARVAQIEAELQRLRGDGAQLTAAPPPAAPAVVPAAPAAGKLRRAGHSAAGPSSAPRPAGPPPGPTRPHSGHLSSTRRRVEKPPAVADGPEEELILNRGDENAHPVKVERQLQLHLRPHQVEGLQFMFDRLTGRARAADGRRMAPTGCVLAHEMGLGKTLQARGLRCTSPHCTSPCTWPCTHRTSHCIPPLHLALRT